MQEDETAAQASPERFQGRGLGPWGVVARAVVVGAPLALLTGVGPLPGGLGWPLVAICALAAALALLRRLAASARRRGRRRTVGFRFHPSSLSRPTDRVATAPPRNQRPWLTRGELSAAWSILAPGVWAHHVEVAKEALDAACADLRSPLKPRWYRLVEPVRALIALLPAAIGFAAVHAMTDNLPGSLAAGILSGWIFGHLLTGVIEAAARLQATRAAARVAQRIMTTHAGLLRPLQPANLRVVDHLLDRADVEESRLRHLSYQAAGTDGDADRAAAELARVAESQPAI